MTDAPETTPELRVGMLIQSNDPRDGHRLPYKVSVIAKKRAILECTGHGRMVNVALSRIFTDGKPRKSGWSVVQ